MSFLWLCVKNDWDLDSDEIKHVLDGDFAYVRDANTDSKTGEYFKFD